MLAATQKKSSALTSKKWQRVGFPILTGLMALAFIGIASEEFLFAWILRDPGEDVHLWHIAEFAALGILLFGGVLLTLVRHPKEKPVLAQFIILSLAVLAIGVAFFEIKALAVFLLIGLFIAFYPDLRGLFSFAREGKVSIPMLLLSGLMALYLGPIGQREVYWQIIGTGNDVHALYFHWIGSALIFVILVMGGALAATKQRGWKELGIFIGMAYFYLGATAMMIQDYAGSWGGAGGLLAALVGVWFVIITLLEAQRTKKAVAAPLTTTDEEEAAELVDADVEVRPRHSRELVNAY